ncbi:MAG TPA: potassium channel family protein [Gemmatimonadota bacterium]|nr:potassium channel family protein [Gemmatimonadota bacterium]
MLALVVAATRFVRELREALRDPGFRGLALFVLLLLLSGSLFYTLVERWRFVDALYFSVVTLTTVGYGDLSPQTDAGKIFTVIYLLTGLGAVAAFVTGLAEQRRKRVENP